MVTAGGWTGKEVEVVLFKVGTKVFVPTSCVDRRDDSSFRINLGRAKAMAAEKATPSA